MARKRARPSGRSVRHRKAVPRLPEPTDAPPMDLATALRERIKELECLYTISSLREMHSTAPNRFLQGVVDCLPQTWCYPEFASARIRFENHLYVTTPFHEGPWRMAADVRSEGKPVGAVEVFYRRGVPTPPDGPFLKEEYALLRVVAERVSHALMHMKMAVDLQEAHKLLQSQHQAQQETNTALRILLSRLEEEKREIRASMLTNVQKIIMPIVLELELAVTGRQRSYVTLLRKSLEEIASPFLSQLSASHLQLTPVEIAISAMIRNGLSTKEIAQLRCISPGTVRRHRENIRRKLGLRGRSVNLVTYLHTAPAEGHGATDEISDPAASLLLKHGAAS